MASRVVSGRFHELPLRSPAILVPLPKPSLDEVAAAVVGSIGDADRNRLAHVRTGPRLGRLDYNTQASIYVRRRVWIYLRVFRIAPTVFSISRDSSRSETARASDIAPTSELIVRIAFDLAAGLSLSGSNPAIN